jgi:hypothetical protein
MSRRITVNVGFITNSSSCVYYFPREVLDDPEVKAFIEAYGLGGGYVGSDLWHRAECSSFLVTKDQKVEAKKILHSYGDTVEEMDPSVGSEASRAINPDSDGAYVLYGDEYSDTTHILCGILSGAMHRLHGEKNVPEWKSRLDGYVTDYN